MEQVVREKVERNAKQGLLNKTQKILLKTYL